MNTADLICRDTPEAWARYMRANPRYFEGLFRMTFSERNLEKAVGMMFPGRPFETGRREIMGGNKVGTCSNCGRGPMTLFRGLCMTCRRAAGSLTGEARERKLAYIKEKIDRGLVKPRGKNTAKLNVKTSEMGSRRQGTGEGVEDRFARLQRMIDEIEALGGQVTISLPISKLI